MTENGDAFYNIEEHIRPINNIDVSILYLDALQLSKYKNQTFALQSLLFILVLNGSVDIKINFQDYKANKKSIILLSRRHFFKIEKMSDDFKCILCHVGQDYVNEMYSSEMLYKRTKYNIKMFKAPQISLESEEYKVVKKRLLVLADELKNNTHIHYQEIILLTLRLFFIELSTIIERRQKSSVTDTTLSRDEIYFQQFLDILSVNYKREHLVDFYAQSLHITPHYLTLIIKRLTGETVSEIIFQLILSESKLLLSNSNLTINQIAEKLNFSDQSAFGKFFKRRTAMTPKEFREKFYF